MSSRANIERAVLESYAAAGPRGRVVLLEGAPGMGKSHLLQGLCQRLPQGACLLATAQPVGSAPLLPILEPIRRLQGSRRNQKVKAALQGLVQAVPWVKEIAAPFLDFERAIRSGRDLADLAPPETCKFMAVARCLGEVAGRKRPVALLCDDLQWYDASSLAFLGYLLSRLEDLPVFLVLCVRDDGDESAPRVAGLRQTLAGLAPVLVDRQRLEPLTLDEIVTVCAARLDGEIRFRHDDLAWLLHSSKGTPQYLIEILNVLIEQGTLLRVQGAWVFQGRPAEPLLAGSLSRLVTDRFLGIFRRYGEAELLVQLGAVAGRQFETFLVAEAAGMETATAALLLRRLVREAGGYLRERKGGVFEFDHDLTRESVLQGVVGDLEPHLHGLLAGALEHHLPGSPARFAGHLEGAGDGSRAADGYGLAAESSLVCGTFAEAARLAERQDRALAQAGLGEGNPRRLVAAATWAQAALADGLFSGVVQRLRPLAAPARQAGCWQLLRQLGAAASNSSRQEDHHEGIHWLREARDGFERAGEPGPAGHVWLDLVFAYDGIGEYERSRTALTRASRWAQEARDEALDVRLERLSCMFRGPEDILSDTLHARERARDRGLEREAAFCANNIGTSSLALGLREASREAFRESLKLLELHGGAWTHVPRNNLGVLAILDANWGEAACCLATALEWACDPGDALFIRCNQAILKAQQGDLGEACTLLAALTVEADRLGDLFHRSTLRANLGRALLASGRPGEALDVVAACPPHHYALSDELVRGRRARLLLEAYTALGLDPPDRELVAEARVLDVSTQPQAWLYRLPYALCEIEFW